MGANFIRNSAHRKAAHPRWDKYDFISADVQAGAFELVSKSKMDIETE